MCALPTNTNITRSVLRSSSSRAVSRSAVGRRHTPRCRLQRSTTAQAAEVDAGPSTSGRQGPDYFTAAAHRLKELLQGLRG